MSHTSPRSGPNTSGSSLVSLLGLSLSNEEPPRHVEAPPHTGKSTSGTSLVSLLGLSLSNEEPSTHDEPSCPCRPVDHSLDTPNTSAPQPVLGKRPRDSSNHMDMSVLKRPRVVLPGPSSDETHVKSQDTLDPSSYGFIVDNFYAILVCSNCWTVLESVPKHIQGHYRGHVTLGSPPDTDTIKAWISEYKLAQERVTFVNGGVPIVYSPFISGARCLEPACSFSYATEAHVKRNHRNSAHSDKTSVQTATCSVQKTYPNSYFIPKPQGFSADANLPASDKTSPLETLLDDCGHEIDRIQGNDTIGTTLKSSNTWLMESGISTFASGWSHNDLKQLLKLTDLPLPLSEFYLIRTCAEDFWENAVSGLTGSDAVLLRHINSDEPAPASKPFRKIQEILKYRILFVKLIAFVARAKDSPLAPFLLNHEQQQAVNKMLCMAKTENRLPRSMLLDVACCLFFQTVDGIQAHTAPVLSFSYLITVQSHTGHFGGPETYRAGASALAFAARLVVHEKLVSVSSSRVETPFALKDQFLLWIKQTHPCVFASIQQGHLLAATIASRQSRDDVVFWEDGDDSNFTYLGNTVSISSINEMLQNMWLRLSRLFTDLTTGIDLQLPKDIYDDYSNLTPGYSFVCDHRNSISPEFFTSTLVNNGRAARVFGNTVVWNPSFCETWKDQYKEFSELRATLMHMTSGMPPRGTESLETLIVNHERRRSLLHRRSGELLWVLSYNKTSHITGSEKDIIRVVWPQLATTVRLDIAFLRPFAVVMAISRDKLPDQEVLNFKQCLNRLGKHEIDASRITHVMKSYSVQGLGFSMGVQDWRQIITSISRHLLEPSAQISNSLVEEELAYQQGHSVATHRTHYGSELRGLNSNDINEFSRHSRRMQRILGVIPAEEPKIANVTIQRNDTSINAGMAELGWTVASHLDKPMSTLVERLSSQLGVSIVNMLRMAGNTAEFSSGVSDVSRVDATIRDRRDLPLESSFRAFIKDPKATFRSENQRLAFNVVAEGKRHSFIIMPTGSGKTMMFLLAVKNFDWQEDVTVVVVPWVALGVNHIKTSKACGVPCVMYDSSTFTKAAIQPIIYVTADCAGTVHFAECLRYLSHRKRLRRIVVDEVHAWITDTEFRPALLDCDTLASHGVPLVLMSGTVPPSEFAKLLSIFRIANISRPITIRDVTGRPTVRYCLAMLNHSSAILPHINDLRKRLLHGPYKAMIFTRTVKIAEDLAGSLQCPVFHSSLDSTQQSVAIQDFESDKFNTIVSTTVLAAGYHNEFVRLVVHHDSPYDYISYIQSSGRAGRGKVEKYAEVHTILLQTRKAPHDSWDHSSIRNELISSRCLREAAEIYMDGFGQTCLQHPPSFVPCDKCEPNYDAPQPGVLPTERMLVFPGSRGIRAFDNDVVLNAAIVRAEQLRDAEDDLIMKGGVEKMRSLCLQCLLQHRSVRTDHGDATCTLSTAAASQDMHDVPSTEVSRIDEMCGRCWWPIPSSLHARGRQEDLPCERQRIIPQVLRKVWVLSKENILYSPSIAETCKNRTLQDYFEYLATVESGSRRPNATKVYLQVCREYLEH